MATITDLEILDVYNSTIEAQEQSLREFGRMLTVYSGWGMRIAFVPDELVHEQPKVAVRKPKRRR